MFLEIFTWKGNAIYYTWFLSHFSLSTLLTPCCSPPGSSAHKSPDKNAGMNCHSVFQGMFPTQESIPPPLCHSHNGSRFFTTRYHPGKLCCIILLFNKMSQRKESNAKTDNKFWKFEFGVKSDILIRYLRISHSNPSCFSVWNTWKSRLKILFHFSLHWL